MFRHFIPRVSFYTPWKTSENLFFSVLQGGSIERNQWHEMGLRIVSHSVYQRQMTNLKTRVTNCPLVWDFTKGNAIWHGENYELQRLKFPKTFVKNNPLSMKDYFAINGDSGPRKYYLKIPTRRSVIFGD